MSYNVPAFRYRWFVENCGLIELPNGKVIVIDPIFRKDEAACRIPQEKGYICGFDDSVVERCDYILLTHIHFDHTGSIRELYERFQAPILVNGWCAYELVKHLDLPTGSVIPMTDGCEYNFDDFRILWQQGRHTAKIGSLHPSDVTPLGEASEKANDFMHMGTTYHSNFIITLPNNMKIAMDGGNFEPHLNELEKHRPTLVLRHASRSLEQCVEEASIQLRRSNSPYMFFQTMQIMANAKEMVAEINQRLAQQGIYGRVVYAEPGQWVTFSLGAVVD